MEGAGAATGLPRVVAVGLGPAGPELTTPAALDAIASSPAALLRTRRHPAAVPLSVIPSCDDLYESAETFDDLYPAIVERVVGLAREHGHVAYVVPGSPSVAERTVELLRADGRVELSVVPGMSFCDLAWPALGVDPLAAGVRIVDASTFVEQAAGDTGPLLVAQCWSRDVVSAVKLAFEDEAPRRAVLLHHLGLEDERVEEVAWEEIDRTIDPDHLTTLYVPEVGAPIAAELARLGGLIHTLREQCPWDRKQTHRSLVRHLLEESYEAIEAIDALSDPPTAEQAAHLEEELGDLLCQVYFHAELASEEGAFNLADVARTVHDKLVQRHPHVFGAVKASSAAAVVANWERAKLDEKGRKSLMDGIPAAMPALAVSGKLERKASGAGLEFADTGDARALAVALEELAAASSASAAHSSAAGPGDGAGGGSGVDAAPDLDLTLAAGELLFGIARLAASLGIDPEAATRQAVGRFRERFRQFETDVEARGSSPHELPLEERLAAWKAVADQHA